MCVGSINFISRLIEKHAMVFNFDLRKYKTDKIYNLLFAILLVFLISIRLFALNQPLFDDETNFVQSISNPGPYYTINPFGIHPHPPLGGWGYFLFGTLLGLEVWVYRLLPLFFWIFNITLVYLLVKKYYSSKAALFSSLLMGLSYYSMLISLQIDIEGSFLTTSFLLMTLFYLNYLRINKRVYLFLLGISFGIGLWIKISAIFFIPVLVLHRFITLKKKKKSILQCFKIILLEILMVLGIGGLLFSIFPIFMPNLFLRTIGNGTSYYGLNVSLMAISMLFFWATPLLIGLFLFQALKFKEKDYFWVIWGAVIFSIYTFLIQGRPGTHGAIGGVAEYSRHFMNLIIPFSVIGGVFLSNLKMDKIKLIFGFILSLLILTFFYLINFNTIRVLPRDFSIYLNAIFSLDFNFLFSFTTSSGNLLGVNFGIILFSIIFSIILFLVYYLFKSLKRKELVGWILVIFISLGVALNLFLVTEYLGPVTSPDVNEIFDEMVDYASKNNINQTLYTTDEGLMLAFNKLQYELGKNQLIFGPNLEYIPNELHGTVLFLNWAPKLENKKLSDLLKKCMIKKVFSSNDIVLGKVYYCY